MDIIFRFMVLVLLLAVQTNVFAASNSEIRVVILGSGTPLPSATQFGPSILLEAGGNAYVFDCGRGCGIRLGQLYGPQGYGKADTLFLTHLHSDHIVGIPELYLNGWQYSRSKPFRVFGPPKAARLMKGIRDAYEVDLEIRREELFVQQRGERGLELDIRPLKEGIVLEENGVTVTAFLVDHQHAKPAYGFRVDFAGRSVVISGDTAPSSSVVRHAEGVDLLLHEVMSPALVGSLYELFPREVARSIINLHTTAEQAGEIFKQTKPGLAVFYHTLNAAKTRSELLAETRKKYSGKLIVGRDLTEIIVGEEITVRHMLSE